MDAFADAIVGLPKIDASLDDSAKKATLGKLPEELSKPVRVALIDDGVDYMHPAVHKNLVPGKSIDSGHRSYDVLGTREPYHVSTHGHGTFMAYMIQRVCPMVEIFVYKIDPLVGENQSPTFYAKSAADIVEDAVKRSFDIISMSWSVQPSDSGGVSNQTDLRRLVAALQLASNDKGDKKGKKRGKESLMFCSASDHGQSNGKNTHYPFNCDDIPKIFRIGAANADGTRYSWTSDQVDFILSGAEVRMRTKDAAGFNEDVVPKTGSSVATALAAGLAALIIHSVKQGAIYHACTNTTGMTEKSVRAIKTYKAMRSAFDMIRKDGDTTAKDQRLAVGAFFTLAGRDLGKNSNLDAKQKWSRMASLARDLISNQSENEFG